MKNYRDKLKLLVQKSENDDLVIDRLKQQVSELEGVKNKLDKRVKEFEEQNRREFQEYIQPSKEKRGSNKPVDEAMLQQQQYYMNRVNELEDQLNQLQHEYKAVRSQSQKLQQLVRQELDAIEWEHERMGLEGEVVRSKQTAEEALEKLAEVEKDKHALELQVVELKKKLASVGKSTPTSSSSRMDKRDRDEIQRLTVQLSTVMSESSLQKYSLQQVLANKEREMEEREGREREREYMYQRMVQEMKKKVQDLTNALQR